jgi:hypothetical protein
MQQILIPGMLVFITQSQALARLSGHLLPEHRANACVLYKVTFIDPACK